MDRRSNVVVNAEDTIRYHNENEWQGKVGSLPPYYLNDNISDSNILVRGSGNSAVEAITSEDSNITNKEFVRTIRRLAYTRRESVHARMKLINRNGDIEVINFIIDEVGRFHLELNFGTDSFETNVLNIIQIKSLMTYD